ncbi:hypothetical protein HHI36_009684, partial [Cryptolaemus montrouzieri]
NIDNAIVKKLYHITVTGVVYAKAVSVCEINTMQTNAKKAVFKPDAEPLWEICLKGKRKIVNIRKKIEILHTYLNSTEHTKKLLKSIRKVASEFSLKPKEPTLKQQLASV